MIDFLRQHWSTISSIGACSVSVLVAFLATKFARREELNTVAEDVSRLKRDVSVIQGQLESMPTKDDIHKLNLEISGLRGDIKEIKPELASVKRISNLLLENELKEIKK
ncbi:DUF2730 family protein [Gilliamella sp. CG22]|uniref:DUF2730 family protein n=1 Tax=Gilliamella sp. CG22 TaxID=3351504 RepID=UPI003987AC6A